MVLLEMHNNKKSSPVLVIASSHFPSLDLKNINACQLLQDINNLRQEFLAFKRESKMKTIVDLKSTVQKLSCLLKKKECKTSELIKVDSHPEPIHNDSYSEILRKPMPQTLNTTNKNDNSSADNITKVNTRRRSI